MFHQRRRGAGSGRQSSPCAPHDVGAREADEQHADRAQERPEAELRGIEGGARLRRRRRRGRAGRARRARPAAPRRGRGRERVRPGSQWPCASVPRFDGQRRLGLHHEILRRARDRCTRRASGGPRGSRPASCRAAAATTSSTPGRSRSRGSPGLLALERAPEEVHEEEDLRGAQDERADGDELVQRLRAASGTRTGRDRRSAACGRPGRCSASGRTCRSR